MKWFLALALAFVPAAAGALTLDEAMGRAVESDPELRALQEEMQAADLERRAAARLLADNPELGLVAGSTLGESFDYEFSLEQPLRLGGQGRARSQAAAAALERIQAAIRARTNTLRAEVRTAFVALLAARRREEIWRDAAALASEAAAAAQERYEDGKIPRIERNGARVEEARDAREAARASVEASRREAALARLLGWPEDQPIEVRGDLADVLAAPTGELPEPGAHPEMQAAMQAERQAAAERERAQALAWPELRIGAVYEREQGEDRVLGTLGISLPFFDRNESERAQTGAALAQRAAEREGLARELAGRRREVRVRLDAAGLAVAVWQAEALEALQENVALATSAWRDGDIDFTTWLVMRREALDGQLKWIDALEELAAARAEWDRLAAD